MFTVAPHNDYSCLTYAYPVVPRCTIQLLLNKHRKLIIFCCNFYTSASSFCIDYTVGCFMYCKLFHPSTGTYFLNIAYNSPDIINYGKYHITLLELSESMKPGGWLHTSVMEIGIQFLTKTLPSSANKVIMPLRIAVSSDTCLMVFLSPNETYLFCFSYFKFLTTSSKQTHMLNKEWNGAEIKELFGYDKRLDKKDMVSAFFFCPYQVH